MIFKEVFNQAFEAGACNEHGLDKIKAANNVHDLFKILLSPQGLEFCMKNCFPTRDLLLKYKNELLKIGVFFEGQNRVINSKIIVVFGGKVKIVATKYSVIEVYATNDAEIEIFGSDNSIVIVEMHHKSNLIYQMVDRSKIKVFRK